MGCYGINRFGVMEADTLVVQSQVRLLKRCEKVVMMADRYKLRQRSSIVVAGLDKVSVLVTDEAARKEDLDWLRSAGVRVVQAAFDTTDGELESA